MCEGKEEEEEVEEQNRNFHVRFFSTVKRINGTLGVYFTFEKLKVFIYKSFVSLRCVYLGVAPVP